MNTIFKVEKLNKSYYGSAGTQIPVLKDLSFSVEYDKTKNNIFSVVAPSGSGKTTLLKILSGIEQPDSGTIILPELNNDKGKGVFIPQEPSSFPWFDVYENIEFAGRKYSVTKERIKEVISLTGLEGYENHTPDNRSIGFRFRIVLARALAVSPSIIFIDETFGKMNQLSKKEIYELVLNIAHNERTIFFLATTNITEAILLSDKIFLMKKEPGEIIDSIDIDFGKDRNLSIINNTAFLDYKRKLEDKFRKADVNKLISFSF